jgi:branched-chain amino acid transport system permease protein
MIQFLQILSGGVAVGATYALVALGLYLVYRVTGVINLAQGAFCVLGALVAYTLQDSLGWGTFAAAAVAVLVTTAIGAGLGAAAFVPGLARLSNGSMLMLTAGLLTLMEGLLLAGWGSQPYVLAPFTKGAPIDFGQVTIPSQAIWVIGTALVVTLGIWQLLTRTAAGRSLRACAENTIAARLVGVDVRRMTLLSFTMAAALGALAGVVVAPTTSLQFDTGRLFTISGFIAVVIGGLGSFSGAIVGAMLLGIVQQLATAYVSSLFSNAIALVLLLAVLVFKPNGLLSAGPSRRLDVRDAARVTGHIIRLRPNTAWAAAFVALVVMLILPQVMDSAGLLSGFVIAGILFISLIGLDVVMGYAGQVNLGQAGFMALGGYTAGYITTQYDVEPLLAIAAAIVLAVLASLILSAVTMRLRGLYLALATLAFGLLIDSCAVGFIDITGGPSGLVGIPSFSIGTYEFDGPVSMYYLVLGLVVALLLLLRGAMRGAFGRSLQAIRTDQMAAAALGVHVAGAKMTAMAISAALGSLAGCLYAFFFHFLSPDMVATPRSLELVAMLIVGGEGTLVGPLLGSVLLTMLPTVVEPLAVYKTFATGALLVLSFLYLPKGLFGVLAGWLSRVVLPGRVTPVPVASGPLP